MSGYIKKKERQKMLEQEAETYRKMRSSILYFIQLMWGLIPQPIKPDYKAVVENLVKEKKYQELQDKPQYFEPFIKGKHVTYQQWLTLMAYDDAINSRGARRITVRSGHGTGKSTSMSWILIHFLYCFPLSQVPCTAPSKEQMYDILWKEASKWIERLPAGHREKFEVQSSYIRVTERPMEWFARAKTARKEAPEALAGVHANDVLLLVDEASGVEDEIFEVGEGSLTEENYVMLMISNGTRLIGYFHESHTNENLAALYTRLHFNSEDSPIVSDQYVQNIISIHGKDSDEYRIRVKGEFARADGVDRSGFTPLFQDSDLHLIDDLPDDQFHGSLKMGVDPAGEGKNKTVILIRDRYKAKVVYEEEVSNPKSIAQAVLNTSTRFKIQPSNIFVDSFGVGSDTIKELALTGVSVNSVNVGESPNLSSDQERFINKRACFYFRVKEWFRSAGELVSHQAWKKESMSIRFRRTTGRPSKIQIMSKREMVANGYSSPDHMDALMLTFTNNSDSSVVRTMTPSMMSHANPTQFAGSASREFNRFSAL